MYSCPPMPPAPCPPECPPPEKSKNDPCSRYIREIGTAMIGNQLIIRMERDKGRSKKSSDWDPPCDCDVVEIQRPSSKEGPKILKGADNNRILFRVESNQMGRRNDSGVGPQAVSYEVGQCKGGRNTNDMCRTFTIYPVLDGPGAQEVHTDRVTEGNENVFMLKVKKNSDSVEVPKSNIELELRTPRPPTPSPVQPVVQRQPERISFKDEKSNQSEEKPKKVAVKKKKRNCL